MSSGDIENVVKFLFVLIIEVTLINSKTSTLWRLNADRTRIIEATALHPIVHQSNVHLSGNNFQSGDDDSLFEIITTTERFGHSWVRQQESRHNICLNCHSGIVRNATSTRSKSMLKAIDNIENETTLDCGKAVNFTFYDNLVGVMNRNHHPNVPESQALLYFTKSYGKDKKELAELTVDVLENRLRKSKREKPRSIHVHNQIGNFWRIKGDAKKAIECYRKVLASSPHHPDGLLNLARMLFSLQYLDDAIFLTRRSLEVIPPNGGDETAAWIQYFTLGEIFKAYGHYQEAAVHLMHTLQLHPGFELAETALNDMKMLPVTAVHAYTLVIIGCLVLGVLLGILTSSDHNDVIESEDEQEGAKTQTQRHHARRCKRSSS